MKIQNTGSEVLRSGYTHGPRGTTEAADKPTAPVQPVAPTGRQGDRVEISDAGRALAARDGGSAGRGGELSPERVSEIRQRILQGAYNSTEVADAVARRMLDLGDI